MITAFSYDHIFSPNTITALPCNQITTTWYGLDTIYPAIRWVVAKDRHALWFFCQMPWTPCYNRNLRKGDFVEGLWEQDVAEFFIRNSISGEYCEFNLSPSASWWICHFSGYRVRSLYQHVPSIVHIDSVVNSELWQVVVAFSLDEIGLELEKYTEIHAACIRHSKETNFFSSNPQPYCKADFHMKECFLPLVFKPIFF